MFIFFEKYDALIKEFSLNEISLDDTSTYKMLSTGSTTGIFQLESTGMKDVLIGRGVIKKAKVGMQMKGTSPLIKKRK